MFTIVMKTRTKEKKRVTTMELKKIILIHYRNIVSFLLFSATYIQTNMGIQSNTSIV